MIVPRAVRGNPVDDEKAVERDVEAQFLPQFAACRIIRGFVRLGHAAGEVPARFAGGLHEQDPAFLIAEEDVGGDPFTGLRGVALGEVGVPGFGVGGAGLHGDGHLRRARVRSATVAYPWGPKCHRGGV
ncbi:hypothetical protein BGM09_33700 [Streptomyces sp. CBMA29]|nr:hypothetical protein [Streptomyces sp. CBMA29]